MYDAALIYRERAMSISTLFTRLRLPEKGMFWRQSTAPIMRCACWRLFPAYVRLPSNCQSCFHSTPAHVSE